MKAHHPLFGALLALAPLPAALAAEEVTGPEADSTEPVRVAPADGSEPVITSEFFNKLTVQTGYGPEDSQVDRNREMFYSLRYEPSFAWYAPEKRWAKWMVYGRLWLNYDTSQSSNLTSESTNDNEREQPEGWYAELRELYVKRNLIGDDPRFSLSIGRQRFWDDYGIWWDDSLESLRLNYQDTFSEAFLAVGQKFHNYNTDVNSLAASEERTLYVMGEYAYRWSQNNKIGVRLMHENDRSDHDIDDRYDFKGLRYGLFFKGDNLALPVFSDYHLELAALDGKMDNTTQSGVTTTGHDSKGWAVLGEVGKRFDALPWTPRIALRGGLTDKPGDENDGFRLNPIQSDRITRQGSYSTRLTSSFVSLDLRNLSYYGIALETRPTPRSALDLRITQLNLRDEDGVLPIRMAADSRSRRQNQLDRGLYGKGDNIGQMVDLNYYWKMFPVAIDGKHLDVNTLVSASYLNAGSALKTGDDYQLSVGVVISY
ncbi:alginate export family protein [Pseudomonas guariconensis]|uniref:alginate export family protein n=1 Tax=Pseudomonas TaxID=286 RepID=UPI002096AF61|nr:MULTISPECIES: alginate export family protein [Pseudomonas]MCO7514947.1 alginate export family protein [Pseudomonas putida]MCO7604174.1 alginate export family protein [Pseudomonas guariconensis]MCO7632697.1 alginate export family protein [Pseudomonas guariconensis]